MNKEEKQQIVLTEENVKKKMEEIQNMRGKKGTSKKDQIIQLEMLATAKISPSMTAQVLVQLISAQFDSSMQRGGLTHMPISFANDDGTPSRENCMWTKCMGNIDRLLKVLDENPELTEEATGQSAVGEARQIDTEFDDVEEQIQVTSNLVSFVERLDDELYLSLRLLDNHSPDFLKRLLDIAPFLELAESVQDYYERSSQPQVAARIAIRRLEHLYYKHNSLVAKAASIIPQKGDRSENREKFINDIAMTVYRYGDDSIKTRAMLSHIYYHALHDRFYQARDMLLMSHLQDSIHQTNSIPTQILFNRTMAQVGLSAFRCGLIAEAHGCFDELCGNNRLKELLAQGLSSQRFNDRTPDQERAEKRRQTPYHMHINLELVECCHLVGAVLIEIPKMVANSFDSKRRITSRALKRVFENSDRNPLSGPPETTRDVIMAGARALEKGDWRQCEAHILSLPVWSHLGSEECVTKVKSMLENKIREEALRTFLFAYSAYYDALSLEQLCEMFKLPKNLVNSLVSKMMIQDELFASWDQPTGSIVMHKKERSRLHHLAQQVHLNYFFSLLFTENYMNSSVTCSASSLTTTRSLGRTNSVRIDTDTIPTANRVVVVAEEEAEAEAVVVSVLGIGLEDPIGRTSAEAATRSCELEGSANVSCAVLSAALLVSDESFEQAEPTNLGVLLEEAFSLVPKRCSGGLQNNLRTIANPT